MDAREFFSAVAAWNYRVFRHGSNSMANLWNAVVALNSVPEWIALARLNYADVPRSELDRMANDIRSKHSELSDLLLCANTLKHVRSHKKETRITSSTGWEPDDSTSWTICDTPSGRTLDVVTVCERAHSTLSSYPELK